MSCTTYPTYNLLTDVDDTRFLPAATELSDRVSGSVDTMNHTLIPTRVSSRNSRHLARSFNANTCTHDDVEQSEPLLHRTGNSVHYESIYDSEEYNSQRNGIEVIRKRLKAHFMTPLQKFKYRGRKPWKLVVQMFKIIFVTAQS
ncbi:Mucolipin-3 [Exaiptasia diaphana]|nr:Mucolipin-3 [Exaiptasia diaphana]